MKSMAKSIKILIAVFVISSSCVAQSYVFDVRETSGMDYSVCINVKTNHISASRNGRTTFSYRFYNTKIDEKGFLGFSFKSGTQPLLRPSRPNHFFIIGKNGIFCNTADDKKAFVFKPKNQNDFKQKYNELCGILVNGSGNNVYRVSTAREFIKALGSDRTIIISEEATLNLYEALSDESFTNSLKIPINPNIDELNLSNAIAIRNGWFSTGLYCIKINNLTIRGSAQKPAKILTEDGEAEVFNFDGCNGIHLENLILGHITNSGCYGNVIDYYNCKNVSLTNCELFGCGIIGVYLSETSDFTCSKSKIYECSSNIVSIKDDCNNLLFSNCSFYNNGGGIFTGKNNSNIVFSNCQFQNNKDELMENYSESPINLKSCVIHHNIQNIGKKDMLITDRNTIIKDYK